MVTSSHGLQFAVIRLCASNESDKRWTGGHYIIHGCFWASKEGYCVWYIPSPRMLPSCESWRFYSLWRDVKSCSPAGRRFHGFNFRYIRFFLANLLTDPGHNATKQHIHLYIYIINVNIYLHIHTFIHCLPSRVGDRKVTLRTFWIR